MLMSLLLAAAVTGQAPFGPDWGMGGVVRFTRPTAVDVLGPDGNIRDRLVVGAGSRAILRDGAPRRLPLGGLAFRLKLVGGPGEGEVVLAPAEVLRPDKPVAVAEPVAPRLARGLAVVAPQPHPPRGRDDLGLEPPPPRPRPARDLAGADMGDWAPPPAPAKAPDRPGLAEDSRRIVGVMVFAGVVVLCLMLWAVPGLLILLVVVLGRVFGASRPAEDDVEFDPYFHSGPR
jgi:hypothetical protein